VQRGHGRQAQAAHELEEVELVVDIEVARRFVEEEDVGLLDERAREAHALAFSAGQRCADRSCLRSSPGVPRPPAVAAGVAYCC
jgi:hypothetical protein